MRLLLPMLLLGLAASLPGASAETQSSCPEGETETPEGCSKQAWADDCPPDMMCAYSSGNATADGNQTDGPTYGDCGGEACAYDGDGNATPFGPEGCIECSMPPPSNGTCMDGEGAREDCRDDVLYIGGPDTGEPTRGPDDGSCENCRGDDGTPASEDADKRDAPGVAPLLALAVMGATLLAIARRR